MKSTSKIQRAVSILDAVNDAPSLASLAGRGNLAVQCLKSVIHLMPPGIATNTVAGPLEDGTLCLLVTNSAIAAKLRQLQPILLTGLANRQQPVSALRIKVMSNNH